MGENCPCSEEYISSYWLTRTGTVPGDILNFNYSFGYNCKRLFNLCLIDPDVLVFSSGNILHFYHISTKKMEFRRSASGSGIGYILKNPNPQYNYLTVAENGDAPNVYIYDYPSMNVISILENGAEQSYTTCAYRQDGEILATQSGEPDYMITIWQWQDSKILLRTKSFQNDVLNVIFSPYNPILITTCGLTHIKFWKMARTFTGIKLQGDLGRFGKTEISDIFAIYPMYDETVISGCDWGNLLVWEAGLIKIEVCRKTRKPCHAGPITLITMDDDDIMTAGLDGYVRIWFWETVELADPPDEDRFVEIEPIFEFYIGDKDTYCEIRALIKIYPDDTENCEYYAQDGRGGIWFCDLNKDKTPKPPKKIFVCHGGKVVAGDSSPISSHIATLGEDGCLHFYDYSHKKLIYRTTYPQPGCDLIWLPTTIDSTGLVLILGFADGVMREICIAMNENKTVIEKVHLIEVHKAHTNEITKLSINAQETLLVSTAKDKTIFFYQIMKGNYNRYVKLVPMGYIETPSFPTTLTWKHDEDILALACVNGEILELTNIPVTPNNTDVTFQLDSIEVKEFQFKSIKSFIRLQIKLDAKAKKMAAKKAAKLADLKKLQELNPGMVIDENIDINDSDEDLEQEPLYFPPVPNPIYWLHYTPANTIWISVGGYDAGYIYEIKFGLEKPFRSTIIADGDDIEIYSNLYIDKYLIWTVQGGSIRINAIKENYLDLTDYWIMGMHDNQFSNVPKIFQNHNGKFLFTIGHDGNIFSYKWNGPKFPKPKVEEIGAFIEPKPIEDIIYSDHPSMEQQKIEAEKNRRLKISNEHKAKILEIVRQYRIEYEDILAQNNNIAPSQQFKHDELELDPRITEDLIQGLKDQLNLVRRKLEFDVEKAKLGREKVIEYFIEPLEHMQFTVYGIRQNIDVKSFKIHKLNSEMDDVKKDIALRLLNMKHVVSNIELSTDQKSLDMLVPSTPEEKFFLGYRPDNIIGKFNKAMQRLLVRYRLRKSLEMQRFVDWEKIKFKKPNPNRNHPSDDLSIRAAEKSIGDYKLKVNTDYTPPITNNVLYKYKDLLKAREELFDLKNDFNNKLFKLRNDKKNIYKFIDEKRKYLKKIQEQIPIGNHKQIPEIRPIDINLEYPEENLKEFIKPGTEIEIEDLLILDDDDNEKKEKKLITTVYEYKFNEENLEHEEYLFEELEWQMLDIQNIDKLPDYNELSELLETPFQLSDKSFDEFLSTTELYDDDNEPVHAQPWKIEKCYRWIIDKIVEQDFILNEIDDRINIFEMELNDLNNSKLEIEKDAKFLEIFLLTLTEELGILKDSEQLEINLIEKTEQALEHRNKFIAFIADSTKLKEELNKSNEKMTEQIKTIQTNFIYNIKATKFFDFLRRIFKKKYKPPKEKTDDSESESESESSSSDEEEEGDEKSLESLDIAPIRLDEDICPSGCDPKLYELAFTLRTERHDLEKAIYTQNKLLEDETKKISEMTKQLRTVEQTFVNERKNLTDFRLEKQKVLNKVETLVVINMDQMHYVKSDNDINDIKNTLLFNSDVINKLNARVGQLDIETLETKRVHRINIVHLQRMTTDCTHMHRQINVLEEDVRQAMCRKFGTILDLDELEESTLKRYVYDTQLNLAEYRDDIAKLVAQKKKHLATLEKELCREIQLNSEKLNIITVLQEEKNFLSDMLAYQRKLLEKTSTMKHTDFRPDIKRLANIRQVQKSQIEFLEREIRTLRIKSKPLEVQPVEKILDTSDLPGIINEENQKIDESAFINLQSISYQFGPDVYTCDRIVKIVQKFGIKYFRKLMSDENIRKYSKKIGQYLGFVAKNFDCDQVEQVTKCVIENFENLVPKKYLINVKPDDIKNLFNEVMTVFNYEKTEVNIDEVLTGIVANSIEISYHTKSMNFSQNVMIEVYKELIEVLTIYDICKSTTLDKLCELLLSNRQFNPRCINSLLLVSDVMLHAKANFIDEFTQSPVQKTVEELIAKLLLKSKQEIPLEK